MIGTNIIFYRLIAKFISCKCKRLYWYFNPGRYCILLNSYSSEYSGFDRVDESIEYTTDWNQKVDSPHYLRLYIECATEWCLRKRRSGRFMRNRKRSYSSILTKNSVKPTPPSKPVPSIVSFILPAPFERGIRMLITPSLPDKRLGSQ